VENKLPNPAMSEQLKVGDIVRIAEEGYAFGKVGMVSDNRGNVSNIDYRVTYQVCVMFPHFTAPRVFNDVACRHATKKDKKQYFVQMLQKPMRLSEHGR